MADNTVNGPGAQRLIELIDLWQRIDKAVEPSLRMQSIVTDHSPPQKEYLPDG